VNLIARELGCRPLAGDDDGASGRIDLHGVLKGGFRGEEKELLKHLDHIVVCVLIIIEQDYVK